MKPIRLLWKNFIQIITFIDLPIRRKFMLFGFGTLFWFLVIGSVAVISLTFIHFRYSQISNVTLPYMKVSHSIMPKMQEIVLLSKNVASIEVQNKIFQRLNSAHQSISSTLMQRGSVDSEANFFESLNYSLSNDDMEGRELLQKLMARLSAVEQVINSADFTTETAHDDLQNRLLEVEDVLGIFTERTATLYADYSSQVNNTIRHSINTIAFTILLAILLLAFFTYWLTDAFAKPIGQIVHQIHSIGTGEVDLSKKLEIKSEDEIGTLSKEFNTLVDTVYGVTVFKKVIEEDPSLDMVYSRLGEVFQREAEIEEYRIFDINHAKNTMRLVDPPLLGENDMFCHPEILNDTCLCRAKKTGHSISSFEYEGVCRQFCGNGRSHVCVPLVVAGRTSGVVQFIFNNDRSDFYQEEIQRKVFKAESYIKHSLSVIETKQLMQTLRESSLVDGLTGLYNRRFLQDHSQQIIAGVLRRKKQISLLMCDMDYFKQVNDKYGHDVGDTLLKETSHILKSSVRESDVVIRFGGEEFLILLIDTELGYGMQIAEKIRKKVEETKFKIPTGVLHKTISMGVCEFPQDTEGFWQAIKFADVALYRAKEEGRNKCVRFDTEMWNEKGDF